MVCGAHSTTNTSVPKYNTESTDILINEVIGNTESEFLNHDYPH